MTRSLARRAEGEEPAAVAVDGDGRRPRRHMAKDDFHKEEDERGWKRATECRDKSHRGRMHRGLNLAFVVFAVALVFSGITRSAVAVFNLITRQRGTPGQKAHQRVMRTVRVAARRCWAESSRQCIDKYNSPTTSATQQLPRGRGRASSSIYWATTTTIVAVRGIARSRATTNNLLRGATTTNTLCTSSAASTRRMRCAPSTSSARTPTWWSRRPRSRPCCFPSTGTRPLESTGHRSVLLWADGQPWRRRRRLAGAQGALGNRCVK